MVAAMASVKLLSGQSYHHSQCYPHHHLLRPASPSRQTMTLEDSLPQRSTSTDYDPGSDSAREMSSPPSPLGSESRDPNGHPETPTKKNKRKLSEPKKRADLTTKKLRQSSPTAARDASRKDSDKERRQSKKLANGQSKRSVTKSAVKSHINGIKRDTSSSSSSMSNNDSDSNKDIHPSLTSVMPPHFLSPIFPGVHASAFGYVPSIYLTGRSFPRPDIQPPFPSIPLNIPHNIPHSYITASATSVPHSSSPPATLAASTATSSMYQLSLGRHPGSTPEKAASEKSQADQRKIQNPANPPIPSPLTSSLAPHHHSLLNLQPSSFQRPGSSRTVTATNDDDEASSSRAASPEDLSIGGKMSRKHRKNYKNMTRERRVEANARERTRVHTISAAFDALRRAVPSYSHNQKLSKLAILRIASSYILSLARLNDQDYASASEHIGKPLTFAECVDLCTNTIQTEGRARRRH